MAAIACTPLGFRVITPLARLAQRLSLIKRIK
jgi:hypothetical protein